MKSLVVFALLIVSCSNKPQVLFDYDRQIDFNRFQTYDWSDQSVQVQYNQSVYGNRFYRKRIIQAIDHQFAAKGYEKDIMNPDLLVQMNIMIKPKKKVPKYASTMPIKYQSNRRRHSKDEITLVVNLLDAEKNRLVWQGVITGEMDIPEEIMFDINQAISLIFSQYTFRAHE